MDTARIEQLLGREFSQADRRFLSYSVPREDVMSSMRNRQRQLYLVVAPRGSGKSGLLLMLEEELQRLSKSSSVVIKRYYEDVSFPVAVGSVDAAVQYWLDTLLRMMLAEIGMRIEVPKTNDELLAVELAERMGMRDRAVGAPLQPNVPDDAERLRFALQRLLEKSQLTYWLLLDEMDDYYSNTPERNNALVGLLQACDAMTKLSPQIVVRLTIRPHIHTYLRTNFDVMQKFRDAELPLHWNEMQLRNILVKRIQSFDANVANEQQEFELGAPVLDQKALNRQVCKIIGRYFADFDAGFNEGKASSYRALQTLSLRRPRWMIEFCSLALQGAAGDFAGVKDFNRAMHEFGRNRLQFLSGEHKAHLPQLGAWVNQLTAARRTKFGSSEEFRDLLIQYVIRAEGASVEDEPASPKEETRALEIAQALYMVEIVRGHQGAGGRDDHRFYTYADAPELLDSWSTRANLTWELHETFARALNIIDNRTYRVGGDVRMFGDRREGGGGRHNRPGSRARRRATDVNESGSEGEE